MKLIWKGRYNGPEQLPKGNLPEEAVKYKEPTNTLMVNVVAGLFTIPVLFLIVVVTVLKRPVGADLPNMFNLWGLLLAFLMILPHELLHAVMFPKEAEVGLWIAPKSLMVFVHCVEPITKWRFILLSFLPSFVFGIVPLSVWLIIPYETSPINNALYSFACLSLLFGVGDLMNIWNTLLQVPNGAMTQISGFHSYWTSRVVVDSDSAKRSI